MKNVVRGVLTLVLCMVLVGFGLCGAFGTFGGLASLFGHSGDSSMALLPIVLGVVGLGIAWACGMAIVGLWRKRPSAGE